ncbi:DEAD-box ATP-dependent RNA helicase 31 [Triticum urartu]|uniref:ATP-dependent RNA helicase n=1 Tax=Triticum urartu TaxID=4572 RepID=M7YMA1_TRIUA|nr:DEAD-box ATP-dependent RNA helicase 31 [Triticum urartu]
MRGRHHLLGFLRRAAAGSFSAARRADSLSLPHPIPPGNGAAVPISTRFLSSRTGGAARSLIEDEADLSDWVSDIKADSFNLGLSSGDEREASTRKPTASRGGRRGRDSGGPPTRSRFDGGEFGGERRGGDFGGDMRGGRFGGDRPGSDRRGRVVSSDLSDDGESGFGSARGRRGRGGMSSGFSQRGGRGGDFGDEAGFRSSRGQRGRGGRASGVSQRGGRYGDLDDEESGFGSPRGRQGRGGRTADLSGRGRRGSDLDDEEDDSGEEVGFGSPRGRRGRGGRASGLSSRGGRGSDLDDEEDDSGEEVGFGSPRGIRGRGGRMSSLSRRGGTESDLDDDDDDDDDDAIEFGASGGRHNRGGRAEKMGSLGSRRGGKVRDVDFGDRRSKGRKMSDFGSSEDDSESGEVDEDDGPSGFEDGLSGDDSGQEDLVNSAAKKSVSSESVEQETVLGTRDNRGADSYLSQRRFDECSLSPATLKGVKAAGYERMTAVQEATLPIILKGKDVLAKARTGTGKTVAFLLPAIEVVSKLPPHDHDKKRPPISVIVVCPTRELADQAAAEANKLLKFHPSIGVQLVIGGTRMALEQKRMHTNPCQILVATPGRLKDHMENTPGFATRLMGVKFLILDEADRLLDMGFRTDIERIVAALPKQRQTLLFSATVPDEVRQVCHVAMKRDLEFVNTVQEGSEETHSQVKQMHLVAPLDKQFSILYGLLTDHISENVDYKLNVREIHSRKPQSYRTRISKEFKESKGLILVSSDVSARGVDYPNVTLVLQLGVPSDREQYIHRLGRTGRKGNEGSGVLLLAPWEEYFLRSIKDLPITEATLPLIDLDTKRKVEKALAHVEVKDKESAYQAWLGYYNSNKQIGRDKYQLVSLANEFSRSLGLNNPPALTKLILKKMGLSNIPGLRSK